MVSLMKHFLVIALFVVSLTGVLGGPAFGIQMTIDAVDDAGQLAGQDAYLKFVDTYGGEYFITPEEVPSRWTSRIPVDEYAIDHRIYGWHLESAGNIWSSDTIVGDALTGLEAGVYRISALDGAFTYDSFAWSDVAGKWLWQLQIYAIGAIEGGEIQNLNYTLGSSDLYGTGGEALEQWAGKYIDITLAEGGKLNFWIADGTLGGTTPEEIYYNAWHRNSIDNEGNLTFDVTKIPTPVPEPATLMLVGTGLFFLVRRSRRSFTSLN
jgi:hypothetical protein